MMYTFYQSVYYASHNQSFPSSGEEKDAFWVGFLSPTNSWILHPTSSYVDLLLIQLMISIPASIYLQI